MTSEDIQLYHKDMVAKLKKPGIAIKETLSPDQCDLLHMAVGISGEVAELVECLFDNGSKENLIEELGDLEFYMEGYRTIVDLPRETEAVGEDLDWGRSLIVVSGNLLDCAKRYAIYNKPMEKDCMRTNLIELESVLVTLYRAHNITRDQALQANMDKLGTRYPNFEYNDKRAQERADKQPVEEPVKPGQPGAIIKDMVTSKDEEEMK